MNKNLILAREIAILLGASIILALSYNAFSPKPLDLIRTETTSIASDSLITALAATNTSLAGASSQNSTNTASEANTPQTPLQTPSAAAMNGSSTLTSPAPSKTLPPQQQTSSGATPGQVKSESANTGAANSTSSPSKGSATAASKTEASTAGTPKTEMTRAETPKNETAKPAKALEIRTDQVEKLLINPDVLFIDARPSHEYQLGHIGNAINIFTPEFEQNIPRIIGLPREKPIVAYCGGGACELSHELAENLLKMGFQRVFVYVGGWNEWKQRK